MMIALRFFQTLARRPNRKNEFCIFTGVSLEMCPDYLYMPNVNDVSFEGDRRLTIGTRCDRRARGQHLTNFRGANRKVALNGTPAS